MIESLTIKIERPAQKIEHEDKIMLMGSCFTEHMSKRLSDAKFRILENPNGVLFNPHSVANSIERYIDRALISESELFPLNDIWNHWDFHTRFSNVGSCAALKQMNFSIEQANDFLLGADWLILTLGSAFQYFLNGQQPVANCHRAPGQDFEKKLLSIDTIEETLQSMTHRLKGFNPDLKIIYTISPVRHIRDGVVDNNRSKARLIEAVHAQVAKFDHVFYFPAYELVIDVLRDYRYYDVDMVHPNFAATNIVWQQFVRHFMSDDAQAVSEKMLSLSAAKNHKVRFAETQAHKDFQSSFLKKIDEYQELYPYVDFSSDRQHFGNKD